MILDQEFKKYINKYDSEYSNIISQMQERIERKALIKEKHILLIIAVTAFVLKRYNVANKYIKLAKEKGVSSSEIYESLFSSSSGWKFLC